MWGAAPDRRCRFILVALTLIALVVATASDRARGETSTPVMPSSLEAAVATPSSITLTWDPSDRVAGAGYAIYVRRPDDVKPGEPTATTTLTRYTLTGLACGSRYKIWVEAFDAAGNRSNKAMIFASTSACSAPPVSTAPAPAPATTTSAPAAAPPTANSTPVSSPSAPTTTESATTAAAPAAAQAPVAAARPAPNASHAHDQKPPSTPTGLATTGSTTTSITLGWSPSIDNVGVAGYGVYMTTGAAAGIGNLVTSTTSTAYTVTGLQCGSTYKLSVDAYDAAGNRSAASTITAGTTTCPAAVDTTPPSVPTNQVEAGATQTTIVMTWSPSTDNVGVTGYRVYLNGTAVGTTTQTTYTYTGLRCGTTYTVGLSAYDAAGNASNPAFASGPMSTSTCSSTTDTQPPSVPSGLTASGATTSAITLSWGASTDNVGVTGYDVYANGTKIGQTTGLSYSFVGLSCGKVYTLSVDAFDAAGNRSQQASLSSSTTACSPTDNQAPTTPTGLVVSSATQLSITITWNASSDNVGVTGYDVYDNGVLTGTTRSLTYTISALSCGTSYLLAVDAYDAAGNRSSQRTLTAATSPCSDTQAPSTPTGLASPTHTQTSVSLQWNASSDNVAVTGYGVYTNNALGANTTSTSYTVSGLACGTSYTFSVDAYDAAGNRSGKASIALTTSACSTPTPSGSTFYMSPSGSGSACSQAAPCATVEAAYTAAAAHGGATVQMAAGSYTSVTLTATPSSSGMVVFKPAAGASVTWGEFRPEGADNIEIDGITMGMHINAASSTNPSSNIIFRNDIFTDADFWDRGGQNVQVIGGEICCRNNASPATVGAGSPTGYRPNGLVLDGVKFHDITRDANPTGHDECLFIQGIDNVTVENSTFTNCAIMDIFINGINGERDPTNIHLLNNTFNKMGPTSLDAGYYTVVWNATLTSDGPIQGFDVEGNTFAQPLLIEDAGTSQSWVNTFTGMVQCNNTGSILTDSFAPPWKTC